MFSEPSTRAPQAPGSGHDLSQLERFLCGDMSATPPLSLVQALNLSGWAYTVAPEGHPFKLACKSAYYAARVRHERIKAEVLTMVKAWNAVGIEPLLYKGFALAEFAYAKPGARFHGDVDVLVRPEQLERAVSVARGLGWERMGTPDHWLFNARDPGDISLLCPRAFTNFDLHQRLAPSILPWSRRERGLTEHAWANARRIEWHGAAVWLLCPEDNFIFGLALTRCWGDRWRLKSHDIVDATLLRNQGLSKENLLERAGQLGVASTVSAFLRRCDPYSQSLVLRWPTRINYLGLECMSARDHIPFEAAKLLMRTMCTLAALLAVPRLLPIWFSVRHACGLSNGLDDALDSLERARITRTRATFDGAMLWWIAFRLGKLSSLTWPLMVYVGSIRTGQRPKLRIGKRPEGLRGWVEVDNQPLPEFTYVHGHMGNTEVVYERYFTASHESTTNDVTEVSAPNTPSMTTPKRRA